MSEKAVVLAETFSLCPECLNRIPAVRERSGDAVFLVKRCSQHGEFRTVVWRGSPFPEPLRRSHPLAAVDPAGVAELACPFECGLCPDHGRQTCCALLEVTGRCNLSCPVCFAASGDASADPDLETIEVWYRRLRETRQTCIVQLSGGEPTVREDLPEVVRLGRRIGFRHLQLNTNGLRLAKEAGYALSLAEAGLSWVFLQFDGTNDASYRALRGRPLLREKLLAVEQCVAAGLGVVLVPTVVPGVNDQDVGNLIRLALHLAPGVRGVHFQPLSYFGRYPKLSEDSGRLTLPELMRAIEEQTDGLIRLEHLRPSDCESPLCSFHGNFIASPDGTLRPLSRVGSCCGETQVGGDEARRAAEAVARRWVGPGESQLAADAHGDGLDVFLHDATRYAFSVSAMAFQDAWSVDLVRTRECCVHVVSPEGGLVPFCLYNLTDSQGRGLHRK